jgi:hypothetical protein
LVAEICKIRNDLYFVRVYQTVTEYMSTYSVCDRFFL